ncbi:hypothetical protein INR49_008971 [Caranx melampygus]|nr:hypothetical protein INR49_008971 [Caranx melampygus]
MRLRSSGGLSRIQEEMDRLGRQTTTQQAEMVRFKLASSYSGRVLKHVYEDGQELDSPEEKYPHSFVHRKIPPSHLEVEQLCGFEETSGDQQGVCPPTGLIAQRINVYRGMGSYKPTAGQTGDAEGEADAPVLDFGKIIIYTSNLRIIRAPLRKPEALRHHSDSHVDLDRFTKSKERGAGGGPDLHRMEKRRRRNSSVTQRPREVKAAPLPSPSLFTAENETFFIPV